MLIQLLKKGGSITMALLVLFSTLSFKVERHYCNDKLVDVSVFSELKKCTMGVDSTPKILEKSCCLDTVHIIKGQDELQKSIINPVNIAAVYTAAVWVYTYSFFLESLPQLIIPHKNYLPPILVVDIGTHNQIFLI